MTPRPEAPPARAPAPPAATRWLVVSVMIGSGIAAALHIGKMPPVLPAIREELALGLVAGGWATSIFHLIGATLGVASGLFADRIGARRVAIAGLVLLVTGSVAGSMVETGAALVVTRVLSGFGLLAVAVSAPRVIVAVTAPRNHAFALGAWSIYVPTGMALGMLSAPFVAPDFGWRGLWILHAAVTALVLVVVWGATRRVSVAAAPPPAREFDTTVFRRPGPWLLAASFGCYAMQFFAMMTWLPTFLVESEGTTREAAALIVALVICFNIAGNLIGAWLLDRGVPRWTLLAATYLTIGPCLIGVFSLPLPATVKVALAILFSLVGGLLPAALLSAASLHAPSPARIATLNGFIVQGSHIGTVAGPPTLAVIVTVLGGWEQGWVLGVVFGGLGLVVTMAIRAVESRLVASGGAGAAGAVRR